MMREKMFVENQQFHSCREHPSVRLARIITRTPLKEAGTAQSATT
jgi:hypothetical protein